MWLVKVIWLRALIQKSTQSLSALGKQARTFRRKRSDLVPSSHRVDRWVKTYSVGLSTVHIIGTLGK